MTRPLTPEEELRAMETQLAGLYKQLSEQYRRMIKVSDEWRVSAMQESADRMQQQTLELRQRLQAKRKEITDAWNASKGDRPPVQSLDRLSNSGA